MLMDLICCRHRCLEDSTLLHVQHLNFFGEMWCQILLSAIFYIINVGKILSWHHFLINDNKTLKRVRLFLRAISIEHAHQRKLSMRINASWARARLQSKKMARYAIVHWEDHFVSLINLENVKEPRKPVQKYKVGDYITATYGKKTYKARISEISGTYSCIPRVSFSFYTVDLVIVSRISMF